MDARVNKHKKGWFLGSTTVPLRLRLCDFFAVLLYNAGAYAPETP